MMISAMNFPLVPRDRSMAWRRRPRGLMRPGRATEDENQEPHGAKQRLWMVKGGHGVMINIVLWIP